MSLNPRAKLLHLWWPGHDKRRCAPCNEPSLFPSLLWTGLLFFSLSSGCSLSEGTPSKGDIYENLMTRERIKIDMVGKGSELRDFYEIHVNQRWEKFIRDSVESNESKRAFAELMMRFPILVDSDTSRTCFSFEQKSTTPDGSRLTMVWIRRLEKLKDYKKLN